jgi:Leucine-rich repeat (LRR) protein
LAQLGKLPNLNRLSIADTAIQSLTADFNSRFPALKELDVHSTDLVELDPASVAGLQSLESIDLSMTSVNDEGVEALAGLKNLRKVDLVATQVTDAALRTLSEMDSLERLNLSGARIGEAESLVQGQWPSLQRLNVINTDVTKSRMEAFASRHETVEVTSPFSTVDLISLIDPSRDASEGQWNVVNGVLQGRGKQCVLPVTLPDAFEIRSRIRRVAGRNSPIFQLPLADGTDVMVGFDHWPQEGPFVIIHGIDGQMEKSSPAKFKFAALPYQIGATCDVSVTVQRVGKQIEITAGVNGSPVATWTGDPQRLTPGFYGVNKHQPSIWSYAYADFLSLELTPLEGKVRLDPLGPGAANLDREVATWTLARGGQVRILVPNDSSITGERFITNLDSLPAVPFRITEIDNLIGVQLPADWLAKVGRLGMLRFLSLRGTKFDNADLAHLQASRSIGRVRFWNSTLNDEGVRSLARIKRLRNGELQHTSITSEAIECFRDHPSLDRLTTNVESDVVVDVAITLPKMRQIGVLSEVSDKTLQKIAQLERLDALHLRKSTGLTDAALQPIVDKNALTELWIHHGDVDASVVASVSNLNKLSHLQIADNPLGPDGAVSLSKLRGLKTLRLEDTGIGDASVAAISSLTGLAELNLTGNPEITDRSVPDLCRLSNLKKLCVHRTGISESGLRSLRSALPSCQVSSDLDAPSESAVVDHGGGNEGFWWLLREQSPRNLALHGHRFSDQSIPFLVRQHQLQSITLDQTHITADGLVELASLPNLRRVVVVPIQLDPTPQTGEGTQTPSAMPIQWADADRVAMEFPNAEVEFLKEIPELEGAEQEGAEQEGAEQEGAEQ